MYRNLQFLNHVIIIETKALLPQTFVTVVNVVYSAYAHSFFCSQRFLSYLSWCVLDEGYSRNALRSLNFISTFLWNNSGGKKSVCVFLFFFIFFLQLCSLFPRILFPWHYCYTSTTDLQGVPRIAQKCHVRKTFNLLSGFIESCLLVLQDNT